MASTYVRGRDGTTGPFQKVIAEIQDSSGNEQGTLSMRIDSGVATATYVGEAIVGSGTAESVWRIKFINEVDSNNIQILYADGDTNFDNKWTEHLILSYS